MNRVTEPHRTVEIQWHPLRVPGAWKDPGKSKRAIEAFVHRCVAQGCEVVEEYVPTVLGQEHRLRIHIPLRNTDLDQVALGKEMQTLFGAEKLLNK